MSTVRENERNPCSAIEEVEEYIAPSEGFLLRGTAKVEAVFLILAMAYNINKLVARMAKLGTHINKKRVAQRL